MKTVFNRRFFATGLTAAAAAAIAPSPIYAWQLTGRHGAKESMLPGIPGLPAASPESGGVTAVARRGKLIHFAAHGMLDIEGTIHGKRVLRPESVALMRSNLVGDLYDGGIAYPNSKGTGRI